LSVSTVHHTHGRRLAWLHTVQVEADGGGAAAGARGQWHGVRHPEGGWAHGLQCPGAVGAPQSVAEAEAEAALVIRLCVMFSQRLNQSRAVVTMGQRLATGPGPALALHSRRHCSLLPFSKMHLSPRHQQHPGGLHFTLHTSSSSGMASSHLSACLLVTRDCARRGLQLTGLFFFHEYTS
jgi:hypothetical protein